MTSDRDALRRRVRETTEAQGVPFHVEDPATLAKVARILDPKASSGRSAGSAAGAKQGAPAARTASTGPTTKPKRRAS